MVLAVLRAVLADVVAADTVAAADTVHRAVAETVAEELVTSVSVMLEALCFLFRFFTTKPPLCMPLDNPHQ